MSCADALDWSEEATGDLGHGGDGSMQNPYHGTLSGYIGDFFAIGGILYPDSDNFVFIEMGTVLNLDAGSEIDSTGYIIDDDARFGIGISTSGSDEDITIHGTVSAVGMTQWGVSSNYELDHTLGNICFLPEDYTPTTNTVGVFCYWGCDIWWNYKPSSADDVFDMLLLHSEDHYNGDTVLNVLRGSYIDVYVESDETVNLGNHTDLSIDDGGRITGCLNGSDVIEIQTLRYDGEYITLRILPISGFSELKFVSDPSEGVFTYTGS